MLKHASRSRHIDPDRPPAAAGGLRSQVPDLVHGPRELLDCRQLQQAGRRERTRSFDRRSRAGGLVHAWVGQILLNCNVFKKITGSGAQPRILGQVWGGLKRLYIKVPKSSPEE